MTRAKAWGDLFHQEGAEAFEMIFFSFSTGNGGAWYVGPLISIFVSLFFSGGMDVLLHAPSFLYQCVAMALELMLGTSQAFSQFLATCFLISSSFGLGSMIFLLMRRQGFSWNTLRQIFSPLFLGMRGRPQRQTPIAQRPPRATTSQVADALMCLKTEIYATEQDLASMTIRELKERAQECKGAGARDEKGTLPALEKKELIDAVLKSHADSSSSSCCICAEDYCSGDVLRVLSCQHRFHIECVDKWLLACDFSRPPACPLCNQELNLKPTRA